MVMVSFIDLVLTLISCLFWALAIGRFEQSGFVCFTIRFYFVLKAIWIW